MSRDQGYGQQKFNVIENLKFVHHWIENLKMNKCYENTIVKNQYLKSYRLIKFC